MCEYHYLTTRKDKYNFLNKFRSNLLLKVHKCLLNLKRLRSRHYKMLQTLQNVTDTTECEIAILIGVGRVCGLHFILVMIHGYKGLI